MTTLEVFRLVAPEFSAVNDATVNNAITFVSDEISESKFGSQYNKALAYLAAHFLAWQAVIANTGSTSGAAVGGRIISEKEGDLSRSYADNGSQISTTYTDNLERTAYGLEFLRIRKKRIVPILTRMG